MGIMRSSLDQFDSLVPPHLIDQRSDFKSYGTMRGGGGTARGATAGGGGGGSSSRQNVFSRSGNNSLLLTSPSLDHHSSTFPPPLSPSTAPSPAENGFYSSADFHDTGDGGGLSLSQSKSYAEKYFPKETDLLIQTQATAGPPPLSPPS